MKNFMPFIITCIILISSFLWNCNDITKSANNAIEEEILPELIFVEKCETTEMNELKMSFNFERQRKINEVVSLWDLWFNDQKMRPDHPRREKFKEYASYLIEHLEYYQNNETDLGGKLPKDQDLHYVIATMVFFESGINPKVKGSKGEVGFLQVHGKALNGFYPNEVQKDPSLGIYLGIRWLAYHYQFCNSNKEGMNKWSQPLSLYGAGLNKGRKKNGECKEIGVAKERVKKARYYKNKIHQLNTRS